MSKQHALLSPSASHRWLHCTPSARLEENIPDEGSEYAKEGTCAHALCEIKLKELLGMEADRSEFESLKETYYDEAMEGHATDYAQRVYEAYEEAKLKDPNTIILIEKQLDFGAWLPEAFGTCDAMIISSNIIEVIDFKYGMGVEVSAEENPQMMMYALGAILEYELEFDFDMVRMSIIQPRVSNYSSWELEVSKLKDWSEHELKPKAKQAVAGEGEITPGTWCRFCKLNGSCKAQVEQALSVYPKFEDKALITDEQMPNILAMIPAIKSWCSAVESYALAQALNGKKYEGFKVVEGRSVRKIVNEELLIERLIDSGEAPADIFKPATLVSLTELEKLVGKKAFAKLAEGCIERPAGKPTLVPESDKRQEIQTSSAIEDFKNIIID